jgi:hypothetical protein
MHGDSRSFTLIGGYADSDQCAVAIAWQSTDVCVGAYGEDRMPKRAEE